MKREILISFLPPVLLSLALRTWQTANFVFRPDGYPSIYAPQESAILFAVVAGLPALVIFAGVRLWIARGKLASLAAIIASALLSAGILSTNLGEAYLRLQWKKSEYAAAAAQHPQDPVIVFDWGDMPVFLGHTKEYLVIARGATAQTFDALIGHEIDSWGDERMEVDGILSAAWDEKDRYRRFRMHHLDACRMRVTHLAEQYYYIADAC